jgi:phytoene/squalene synthetase
VKGAAERIVHEVESMRWNIDGATVSVSATTGIAHASLIASATLEQLLEAADRDLYARKWIKKNPGERSELYEYPGRSSGGTILSLGDVLDPKRPARATES